MPWTLTSAPAVKPVTLTEVKDYLRIEHEDEDDWLGRAIDAATTIAQNYTRRQFINATWTYRMPGFPTGRIIQLGKPPLSSVTSVTYADTAGTTQTLAAATYYTVYTNTEPGYIELKQTQSWPSTYGDSQDVAIQFIAGYGATSLYVPAPLRIGICALIANWHIYREPGISGATFTPVPETQLHFLLGPYKVDWS